MHRQVQVYSHEEKGIMPEDVTGVLSAPEVQVKTSAALHQRNGAADDIVEVRELRKTYTRRTRRADQHGWTKWLPFGNTVVETSTAVDAISFSIQRGEIFGLLGPNGAGKTTTIRMLCTLLEPTGGTATINGYDVSRQPGMVRQNLGAVLTGDRSIYWKLTGRENLEYFAALYHIPPAIARQRVAELLDRLDLAGKADERVERYSTGMKQRVAIARALLANPPVLLLDEPTTGLDPQSARNLRELIQEIKQEGRTILLTTHYMEEADQLSDRVGIIDLGRIIALDTPARLKRTIKQIDIVRMEVEQYNPMLTAGFNRLPSVQNTMVRYLDDEHVWAVALHTTDSRNLLPHVIEQIGAHGGSIRHLQIDQPTLEDVFITLTGKQLRD
jgi:ABC-2 type transport system ATP-binding protein